jgi:hypothetical protein
VNNPFQQSMVKLQIPAGMGSSISARGFTLDADADGCVEVPVELAAEFKAHGLVPATAVDTAPKKK